jgi:hypothetical protein
LGRSSILFVVGNARAALGLYEAIKDRIKALLVPIHEYIIPATADRPRFYEAVNQQSPGIPGNRLASSAKRSYRRRAN